MPRIPSENQRGSLFIHCLNIRPSLHGSKYEIHSRRQNLMALLKEQCHLRVLPEFSMNGTEQQLAKYIHNIYDNQSLVIHHNPRSHKGSNTKGIDTFRWLLRTFSRKKPLLPLAPVFYMTPDFDYYEMGDLIEREFGPESPVSVLNEDDIDFLNDGKKLRSLIVKQRVKARDTFKEKFDS